MPIARIVCAGKPKASAVRARLKGRDSLLNRSLVHRARGIVASEHPDKPRRSMGSNKKKKTTMAKLNRETALRERRLQKQARKDARRQAAETQRSSPGSPSGAATGDGA